ncbi:MAG: flavin reductase family protein [Bacteroidota bacterium]
MNSTLSIDPNDLSTAQLHGYMLAAVAPRPIAFASTMDRAGNINLSPFSFFNCFGSNPPVMIFSSARRVRDNTTKHTLENIREVPEVVINIVNFSIVEQMSLSSTEYEKGINEFVKAGLTQVASDKIHPPRVGEAPVAFECLVDQVIETGTEGGAGNLIVARVIKMHVQTKYLDENNKLDTTKLDLVGRMGGSWYCRASGEALFEIPKPLRTKGIGIDQLPESIKNSGILTGNNLGRLGNVEKLPSEEEVIAWGNSEDIKQCIGGHTDRNAVGNALHLFAKKLLENGDTNAALKTLLFFDVIH